MKKIAIHFARFGPYHLARLESAVAALGPIGWRVLALETAGMDATYDWKKTNSAAAGHQQRTIFPNRVFEEISPAELKRGIFECLDEIRPDAMAIAGWGTADARACLAWCKKNQAKAIVMSETRWADGRRVWWKEWLKSRIVRRYDGALCGGESHKRYLVELGIPAERVEMGYNVVDNEFFGKIRNAEFGMGNDGELIAERSKQVPCSATALAGPYFLASNRFVERKNLARLIEAYAKFAKNFQEREGIWPLVLLGDGSLKSAMEELARKLGLEVATGELNLNYYKLKTHSKSGLVVFPGFRQIEELPAFYDGAGAFVHPALEEPWGLVINEAMASGLLVLSSRNVGAAEELVVEGKSGFLFDPEDVNSIAESLFKVFSMSESERHDMGMAARKMLERKVPTRAFGEGLAKLLGP